MTDKELLQKFEDERQPCEVWTRCMGYFRPVSAYNIGKQSEYNERVLFTEDKAMSHVGN